MVCDDYSGYKARFISGQMIEVGCMVHARRKFHELHVTAKSQIDEQALSLIQQLYRVEAEFKRHARVYSRTTKTVKATGQSTDHAATV